MTTPSTSPQAGQQTQTHESDTSFRWLVILLAIIAASLLGLYFMNFNGDWGNQGDFGAFGDFLGGVLNPILGFATVGLLIWSLKLQMNELALSRQELTLTRQELAETKKETSLSRKAMEEQVNHIKNEAKLNELTRLLERSQKKYEVMMNASFPIKSFPLSQDTNQSINDSYNSLLNDTILTVGGTSSAFIINAALRNRTAKRHLVKLRRETILISDLALKYYSVNESTEFARAYLFDSFDMLQTIGRIYPNEITQNRLSTIASLMGEFLDVAKVPSTIES